MLKHIAAHIRLAACALALHATGAIAQCPTPEIKMLTVYGGSVQFVLNTETQLQAMETMYSGHTRLKVRFHMCNSTSNTPIEEWELQLAAADAALPLSGSSSPGDVLPLNDVMVEVSVLTLTNCTVQPTPSFILTNSPQTLATGHWSAPSPTPNDVMEAELMLTYKLRGPQWGRKPGVYLTNLQILLKEV